MARVVELYIEIAGAKLDRPWKFADWEFTPPYRDWGMYQWRISALPETVLSLLQHEARAQNCSDFDRLSTLGTILDVGCRDCRPAHRSPACGACQSRIAQAGF